METMTMVKQDYVCVCGYASNNSHQMSGHQAHCADHKAHKVLLASVATALIVAKEERAKSPAQKGLERMTAAHSIPVKDDLVYWNLACGCRMCGAVAEIKLVRVPDPRVSGRTLEVMMITVSGIHLKDRCTNSDAFFKLPWDTRQAQYATHRKHFRAGVDQNDWRSWDPAWKNFEVEYLASNWSRRECKGSGYIYWNVGQ